MSILSYQILISIFEYTLIKSGAKNPNAMLLLEKIYEKAGQTVEKYFRGAEPGAKILSQVL